MHEALSDPAPGAREILWTRNASAVPLMEVPLVSVASLRKTCLEVCAGGGRLVALTLVSESAGQKRPSGLLAVLAEDRESRIGLVRATIPGGSYPALTPDLPQAQAFEREILELSGIRPTGHPWPKPLRRHADLERVASREEGSAHLHEFFRVEGPGIHEVAVGPVHAGIIEPGHFRFQCQGEIVQHLEIQLGYQHRGAEALFLRSPPARRLVVAESIAGDTVIGHAWAYCQALEALAGLETPLASQAVRGIALELERLANHVGDLGALCNDVGYLPGASWFGRLRGEFLNLLLELSGNRFGRGLVTPGGVRYAIDPARREELVAWLQAAEGDLRSTAQLTFDSNSVSARFDHTGALDRSTAQALGLVGPVARASGCERDVRRDHPSGIYRFAHIPVSVAGSGDVMARALVRWLEIQRSLAFVREQVQELRGGPRASALSAPRPRSVAVSLIEGWRGEIVHLALSDGAGALASYRIVDPSFHNWFGLALALRGQQISDFPLCNKSFNLSYAGHDL